MGEREEKGNGREEKVWEEREQRVGMREEEGRERKRNRGEI